MQDQNYIFIFFFFESSVEHFFSLWNYIQNKTQNHGKTSVTKFSQIHPQKRSAIVMIKTESHVSIHLHLQNKKGFVFPLGSALMECLLEFYLSGRFTPP